MDRGGDGREMTCGVPIEVMAASIKSLTVASHARPGVSFTDGEVDRSCGAWHERDDGGLVALVDDPQRPLPRSKPRSSTFVEHASET